MSILVKILAGLLIQLSCPVPYNLPPDKDLISIEYLGHSCFYLGFNQEVSVLTDYGKPDAYKEYGWSSPIQDMGNLDPDIFTYSHRHDDHYDPERSRDCDALKYFGDNALHYKGLSIIPIQLSEADINTPDNYAYLFEYKDTKILHLGDCQANIMSVNNPSNREFLLKTLPAGCQIFLVPLEGQTQFPAELITFIQILDTELIIPMHYWSKEHKDSILSGLSSVSENEEYEILHLTGNRYTYHAGEKHANTIILDLQ